MFQKTTIFLIISSSQFNAVALAGVLCIAINVLCIATTVLCIATNVLCIATNVLCIATNDFKSTAIICS